MDVASTPLALTRSQLRSTLPGVRARIGAWLGTRRRAALGAGLERAAWAPSRSGALTCAVSVDADAVRLARPDLLALAKTLRSADPVTPRGLAMVEQLLSDGASSLYQPRWSGELREAVLAAHAALDARVAA